MAKRITQDFINNLSRETVLLTNEDKLNETIDYPFNVVLKALGRSERAKIDRAVADEDGMLDGNDLQKALFMAQVLEWNGLFENEQGENIPATDEFKEKVYEHPFFKEESDLIISKILEINGIKFKKEEDLKKNVENLSPTEQETEQIAPNVH